jgi:short-subunit dehydrogenase
VRPAESPTLSLTNKRIMLTGGSGGIGELTAAVLLREGATVTVMSRSAGPQGAGHIRAELATADGIAAACASVSREEPDILINMAGVQHFGPVEMQPLDELCAGYNVNLVAPVALCRACLPAMRRRNAGQIVNIGSILGSIGCAHFASYSSAKAGLRAFSEALRRELVDTAISVTYVAPRAARTRMVTRELEAYAKLVGMNIDSPDRVSARIVEAIKRHEKDVYIGFPEGILVRINAVLPRLFDAAVAGRDRQARELFAP